MEEFEKYLSEMDDTLLIKCCTDIYEYKNGVGDIHKDGELYKLSLQLKDKFNYNYYRATMECVMNEALKRYSTLSKLLITEHPRMFIK